MNIISLENINKSYGDKGVLKNFSIQIEDGEFIAIMGASGSGKSTLLNIIGCLESIDSGKLIIDGVDNIKVNSSKSNKILREKIGYLFQNFALIDERTVRYNLEISLKYASLRKKEKNNRIKEALKYVGLEGYEDKKIYELSGGEAQRVALARIMLKPCKIILADEPTGSLDPKNVEVVLNILKALNKEGKTVVIVTHDEKVASYCDRVINI